MHKESETYGEGYYTNNNYAGYLERSERYERMVEELEYELFRILKLDFKDKWVLDYGCGVGFVVRAFQKIGYAKVFGYDHSEWAVAWGRKNLGWQPVLEYESRLQTDVNYLPPIDYDLMTSFDVFEHMNPLHVSAALFHFQPKHLLVRIPLTDEDGGKFILPVSEADPTHITRLTRESWVKFFKENKYEFLFNINLGNIYDSKGVMCAMFRNSNT